MATAMEPTQPSQGPTGRQSGEAPAQGEPLSPQLVQQVAEKVLAMMLQDMRIEFERTRDLRTKRR